MKTKLILLAALMFGGVAQTQARCDSDLLYKAQVMERMADSIAFSHRDSVRGRLCGEDQQFMELAYYLQKSTDRFLCQVREEEDEACLLRTLGSIRSSFGAVRSKAACIRVTPQTNRLICDMWNVIDSVRIRRAVRDYDQHEDFDRGEDRRFESPRRESVSDRDLVFGAIGRLLGSR